MRVSMMLASAAGLVLAATAVGAEPQYGKSPKAAVNTSAQATYGTLYLDAGFTPDPHRVDLYSGGSINASDLGGSCTGMIATSPDVELNYDAGSLPLQISATSSADTTLVINGPDGRWYCDDDSGDGNYPLVNFSSPMSGAYDIYVGAYGGNTGSASLFISEIGRTSDYANGSNNNGSNYNNTSSLVDASLNANSGTLSLRSGFTGDPRTVRVVSGGGVDASEVASGCRGFVSRAPDVEVSYGAGSLPLIFSVSSGTDTTLMINSPDGQWYCDDDGGVNGMNPAIRFNSPRSGVYDVWIGSYSSGGGGSSTLYVSELSSQ